MRGAAAKVALFQLGQVLGIFAVIVGAGDLLKGCILSG